MDSTALLTYVQRRLGIEGMTDEQTDTAEIFDCLTEGRDEVRSLLAEVAEHVVKESFNLEVDGANDRLWKFPAAKADATRIVKVKSVTTGEQLNPAGMLNEDGGEYVWDTHRQLLLADHVDPPGGVAVEAILQYPDVTAGLTPAQMGVPDPATRAVGKFAVVLALTADEESDAANAVKLLEREFAKLERLYGDFDRQGGQSLRELFLMNYGRLHGDSIY